MNPAFSSYRINRCLKSRLVRLPCILGLAGLWGAGNLPAQTEYAVLIREAGGRSTASGEGGVRNKINSSRGSSRGTAYSVAVSSLGMTGARMTGTAALTVGTASATLPITGSIDKNGFFALTARGTGANRGFGCVLLYDVATGAYRPNKNTVTAPKQKAIKF